MIRKYLVLVALFAASSVFASVTHDAFGPVSIGERATVKGAWGGERISDARLYFKSNLSSKFSFVELDLEGEDLVAQLPAPGATMSEIEYFFAVTQNDGELIRSSVYSLSVSKQWAEGASANQQKAIEAFSELSESDENGLIGFIDNVKTVYQAAKLVDKIGTAIELASLSNYSVVAGPSATTATSTASNASSASTSSSAAGSAASAGGMGVLGATAAVVGGVAVAGAVAGASGGDDDDDFDISSCPSFGFELSDGSFRTGWYFANGRAVLGSNDPSFGCELINASSYGDTLSCSELEDLFRESCNSLNTEGLTCSFLTSRPSYLNC
jgi:hypothetical protein